MNTQPRSYFSVDNRTGPEPMKRKQGFEIQADGAITTQSERKARESKTMKKTWEEEFENFVDDYSQSGIFDLADDDMLEELKSFIKNLLFQSRKEVEEEFLNQPANQHDQEVRRVARKEVKEKLIEFVETL